MPRPKPTADDLKERKTRAKEWRTFRRSFKVTQRKLEDILGISRRTIQMVEAAKISPHAATLTKFEITKNRYESGQES